jgi:hypothetical protein
MSDPTVRTADVIALLREACRGEGGQSRFARQHSIPQSIVNEVLHGKRDVSETIANALGYVRVVIFREITKQETT